MGSCNISPKTIFMNDLQQHYQTKLKTKLTAYAFGEFKVSFAYKIAKENGIKVNIAEKWIGYYILFMVYVGWLFDISPTPKK